MEHGAPGNAVHTHPSEMRPLLRAQVIHNLRASWQDRKDGTPGAEPARPCTHGSLGPKTHAQTKPLLHYLKWEP